MSTVMVPVTNSAALGLQCEQCNSVITSEKAVAYLLVDQVPCAWCERCFAGRQNEPSQERLTAISYIKSGNSSYARAQWSRALSDYNRAIEIDPDLAPAYANRGLVYLIQGRRADAEKDLLRCLHLDGKLRPALQKSIKEIMQRLGAKRHN
ncbi:MAG TPA: tetratricopeptide repeat protein [Blastocatellia bacterium]